MIRIQQHLKLSSLKGRSLTLTSIEANVRLQDAYILLKVQPETGWGATFAPSP